MFVCVITECLEVGGDVHLACPGVLGPACLPRLVHGPGHGDHHRDGAGARAQGLGLDDGHPVLGLAPLLAPLDPAELMLDVGH